MSVAAAYPATWDPSSDEGWKEGNGWQYLWLVPHDVAGLADAIGGTAATREHDVAGLADAIGGTAATREQVTTRPVLRYRPAQRHAPSAERQPRPRGHEGGSMRSKTPTPKEELLKRLTMFKGLGAKELSRVAVLVDEVQLPAGSVLMREGRPGHEAFVLTDGQATVSLNGDELATLGPGDPIGEMALLDQAPRSATVTADTDVHLLVLTPQTFDQLLAEPPVAKALIRSLASRLRSVEGAPEY